MDFALSEELEDLRGLARRIFSDRVTEPRRREIDRTDDHFDRELWRDLADAGLLGVALPEEVGGAGYGMLAAALLLEEAGRVCAPVPLWPALALGGFAIAEHGTPEQRAAHLPPLIAGETVPTAAMFETGAEPTGSRTTARADGDGWVLDGVKECVPAAHVASVVLVPASTDEDRVVVFLVDPSAAGVTLERQQTTMGEPEARLTLSGVRLGSDAVLGGDPQAGDAIVRRMRMLATAGLCALAVGVTGAALEMTAEYTKGRVQFDRPIATFQAVAHRAADAYIDSLAIRLTALQAAWRIDEGLDAEREVAIAKFFAAEAGQRVVHAAQHLHGGIGVDLDYPLHRYFRRAKQIELTLGGANEQLRRLGAARAAAAITEVRS